MEDTPFKFDFRKNLGRVDRVIRSLVGLGLVLLAYTGAVAGGWGTAAIVFGVLLILEAAIGY